ncbi:hypothetical protein FR257_11935 [Salmonella enterica subsp. enterica]|nr:hypothetical protein [Salmonella enterica subsp. enterica serovar Agbeni]ECL0916767.1 hypothetical protein [Salmonella enterica subsp. enterica serovar Agbeni]
MTSAPAVVSRVFGVWEVKKEGEKNPDHYQVDVEIFCDGFYRNAVLNRPTFHTAILVAPGDDVRDLQ